MSLQYLQDRPMKPMHLQFSPLHFREGLKMHLIHVRGNIIIPIMEAGVDGIKMLMSLVKNYIC